VQVLQVEDLSALYEQSLEAGCHAVVICSPSKFVNPSHLPITVMIGHFSSDLIVTDVFSGKVLAMGGWF
jgi:hypothetical protein